MLRREPASSWAVRGALLVVALAHSAALAAVPQDQSLRAKREHAKANLYRTNFSAPPKFPPARQVVRAVPPLTELVAAKEAETLLRRQLTRPGLVLLHRIELQAQLVETVESAGEDPLPELETLCGLMAGCEPLGPKKAWEQASEIIGQLDKERFYDECIRYSEMVLRSRWADREARAWAMLRVIVCHRVCHRVGTVHPLSERLMRDYPETTAACMHTKGAAGWLEAYVRDEEAIDLFDRMAELHKDRRELVAEWCVEAADICRRTRRYDRMARFGARLRALASDPRHRDAKLRARCAREAERIERLTRRGPAAPTGGPRGPRPPRTPR